VGLNRREFLQRAGMTGGALAAAAALPACHTVFPLGYRPHHNMLRRPARQSPIDTVVIVMSENRSFDHWLGWLGRDVAYREAGRSRYGRFFHVDADNRQTYIGPNGPQSTQHMIGWSYLSNPYRGCDESDPNHSWTAGRAQRDHGFIAPDANDDLLPIGYYEGQDLPFTQQFAKRFTVFDDYHASLLGPTYPNRDYLHCAQSGGRMNNAFPTTADGFPEPTIWEKLAAAGVSANYYASDLPFISLFGPRMTPFIRTIDDFFQQCADGTLPHVVMVDPAFLGPGQNDDHPLADVRAGQAFQRRVFKAFAESRQWQRGVYISTYDEWGGWFDHAPTVHFPDDRANSNDLLDFSQAGFRVPTVMASPYCHPGLVDSRVYDHTSILRFLEWRFLGAPAEGPGRAGDSWFLTRRDRYAANIGASLSSVPQDMEIGFDIDMTIDPPSAACATSGAGSSPMAQSILEGGDPAFDEDRWRTWLDMAKMPARF
jgi:phospholipase C